MKNMKRLFKFKYPKIGLLIVTIILSYYIFRQPGILDILSVINGLRYLGIFSAGIFLSFGFTAPFAVGFFIALVPENIWIASLIGGLGAALGDLILFWIIRFSFQDEFNELEKTKTYKKINFFFSRTLGKVWKYLLYVFAGILIASPLPDEAGITMLSGLTKINPYILGVVAFILHSFMIFLIFLI